MNKAFAYIVDMNKFHHNLSLLWEYLSIKEQNQAKRYYNKLLTERYIISHGILRYILSYYVHQPASKLEFTSNIYGKPFLKDNQIQFNMSHSGNIACYVVTFNNQIGVDIEFQDNTIDIIEISELIFTPQEIELLKSLNYKAKYKSFYTFWTKKEALVKALGKGLSYPINKIETMGLLSGKGILFPNENSELQQKWYCYELKVPKNYSGAIGTENKIDKIAYLEMCDLNILDN